MKRVNNIRKHLNGLLKDDEPFYIGITAEEYSGVTNLNLYGLPNISMFVGSILPNPVRSVSRANVRGRYVRKEPEEKVTIRRHIEYTRRRDGVHVSFDRNFYVYKKVLQHQFEIKFVLKTNMHGQKLVICEELLHNSDDHNMKMKNKHIANLFCEIFETFEIYDTDLNPAIHFNTRFDEVILPSGRLEDQTNFDDIIRLGDRFARNEDESRAFQERLKVLQEYKPDIRGKGPKGFFGYLVFGFTDLDIIVLETIYSGNATYIFTTENFENKIISNKQEVLRRELHLQRIYHDDNWERKIRDFMNTL